MKLIKLAFWLVVLLVVLLIGAVVAVFFGIDALAREGITRGSSYALQVPVTLDKADVSIVGGSFTMEGFTLGNPGGFRTAHFLAMRDASVSVSAKSLATDLVELPTLTLRGIDLNLERADGKSNYGVILESLKRFESGGPGGTAKPSSGAEKKFTIRQIRIEDVNAHVTLLNVGERSATADVAVPSITLENVGSGGGVSMGELASIIVKALLTTTIKAGGDMMPDEIADELSNQLKSLASLDSLGVTLPEGVQGQVDSAIEKGTKAVGDAIKGLLPEKK